MTKINPNISFEEAITELENIISTLEKGSLSLEDSLAGFSKGIDLYKYCYNLLNKAEGKVKIILNSENGELREEDFITNS